MRKPSLADLLLSKPQIIEIGERDALGTSAILREQTLRDGDRRLGGRRPAGAR